MTTRERLMLFGTAFERGRRTAAYRKAHGMDESELARVTEEARPEGLSPSVAVRSLLYVKGFQCGWFSAWPRRNPIAREGREETA